MAKKDEAALLQQKYLEYQAAEQQSRQIQDQLRKIGDQLYEIEIIKQSLDDYGQVKEGKVMLSPVSSGIFVKSKVADTKNFYVNVGSNIVVKKNLEETKRLMDDQAEELRSAHDQLAVAFEEINSRLQELESQIMGITGKKQ